MSVNFGESGECDDSDKSADSGDLMIMLNLTNQMKLLVLVNLVIYVNLVILVNQVILVNLVILV